MTTDWWGGRDGFRFSPLSRLSHTGLGPFSGASTISWQIDRGFPRTSPTIEAKLPCPENETTLEGPYAREKQAWTRRISVCPVSLLASSPLGLLASQPPTLSTLLSPFHSLTDHSIQGT